MCLASRRDRSHLICVSVVQEIRTSARGRKPVVFSDYEDDEDSVSRVKRSPSQTEGGSKRGRPCQKSRLVDITSLLGLPQRQAAEVLGISESMLCKRYKECTKRKWPYRYLGKIEKKIAAKQMLKKRTGSLSAADEAALASLLKEREMCLTPVSIRVTDSDGSKKRKSDFLAAAANTTTSSESPEHDYDMHHEEVDESYYNDHEESRFMEHGSLPDDFNPATVLMALAATI